MDICSTLHHTWTYQALIHDLFNLYLNRCKVEVEEKVKNYDLGPDDQFWSKNKGMSRLNSLNLLNFNWPVIFFQKLNYEIIKVASTGCFKGNGIFS